MEVSGFLLFLGYGRILMFCNSVLSKLPTGASTKRYKMVAAKFEEMKIEINSNTWKETKQISR